MTGNPRTAQAAERGYRNFLTLDAILTEARAVADAEGLDAVSMRTLATRLGCTPRALYRHVTDKDEVLELVADRALAELSRPPAGAPWATALLEALTALRELLVASPAVAQIIAQQPVAGPEFRRYADGLARVLIEDGVPPDLAAEAVVALAQYTLGASLPGTGQRLHDTYRTRSTGASAAPSSLVTQHFATADAAGRFRVALRRLIGAYE